MRTLFLIEAAVASVALSHPAGHGCDVCKAAAGDLDAMTNIVKFFLDEQREKLSAAYPTSSTREGFE